MYSLLTFQGKMFHIVYEEIGEKAGEITLPHVTCIPLEHLGQNVLLPSVQYSHHFVTQFSRVSNHLHRLSFPVFIDVLCRWIDVAKIIPDLQSMDPLAVLGGMSSHTM